MIVKLYNFLIINFTTPGPSILYTLSVVIGSVQNTDPESSLSFNFICVIKSVMYRNRCRIYFKLLH